MAGDGFQHCCMSVFSFGGQFSEHMSAQIIETDARMIETAQIVGTDGHELLKQVSTND